MRVGIVGVMAQRALEGGRGQVALAQLRQDAAQVRAGLDVIFVQLDGHIVALARRSQIALAIEQLGQLEAAFGVWTGGGHRGAMPFGRLGQPAVLLQLRCKSSHLFRRYGYVLRAPQDAGGGSRERGAGEGRKGEREMGRRGDLLVAAIMVWPFASPSLPFSPSPFLPN